MQNIISAIITFIFILSINLGFSQNKVNISSEIITENGRSFILHHISKGETLYAISKAYKTPIDSIEAYNANIDNGIQIGNDLKIPISKTNIKQSNGINTPIDTIAPKGFVYHKVIKGETLYRISFDYQVKIEELKKYNPELNTNISIGQWILIPTKDEQKLEIARAKYDSLVDYKIGWFDNYYRLEKKFKLNQQQLEQINPQLITEGVKRGLVIKVPYSKGIIDSLPHYGEIVLDSIHEEEIVFIEEDSIYSCNKTEYNLHTYKIALMLPLYSNLEEDIRVDNEYVIKSIDKYPSFRFIEFYQGALLALDSLKQLGFKAEVYVWDTKGSETTTDSICQLPVFKDIDIVIGPFYSKNVNIVREYADSNSIKYVDLFSQIEIPIDSNTQRFEIRTSIENKYMELTKYVNDSLPYSKIVIIHSGRPSELENLRIVDSTIFLPIYNIDSSRVKVIRYQKDEMKTILKTLSADSTNIYINLIDNEAIISDFLRQLDLELNNKDDVEYDIIVMAHHSVWSKYKTIELNYLNNLKYTYALDYYIDYSDSTIIIPYELKFYNKYKRIPSKLGYIGHDVVWYFGNALYNHGINFHKCIDKLNYNTMHNNLLIKKENKGYYRNHHTSVLQYSNYKIIKKN